MNDQLLINLSFLTRKPTGHTVYAKNLLPALKKLNPTLLTGEAFPDFKCHAIPATLTTDQGKKGHLARLFWTQFQAPQIYQNLRSRLLFSPIPEAPIFRNCRLVVTLHDFIPLRFPRKTWLLTHYYRYYLPQVLKQAEQIICDSESTARDAIAFCQVPAHKLNVVHLAHDAQNFRFLDLEPKNYFLYIGRHDPYKNLERSLSAFAQVSGDAEFWIAGPPDPRYTPILERLVAELGIVDRVKFLSYVPYAELPVLLNQAIALVFATRWEGFGLPVLEGMACGTPVITSNVSSLPEVAGDAAISVDPYNQAEIQAAMQDLIRDPGLRSQLRQRGIDRATQFSWATTGSQTAAILQPYLD